MDTDPQHLLPAHLPFYKRRIFWGIVLSIQFIINVLLFILVGFIPESILTTISLIVTALGGGVIYIIYALLMNNPPYVSLVTILIYLPLLFIFIYKINNNKPTVFFGVLFSVFMLISLIIGIILSSAY